MELMQDEGSTTESTTERDKLLLTVFDFIKSEFPEVLVETKPGEKVKLPLRKFGKMLTGIAGDLITGQTPPIVKIFESLDIHKVKLEVEELRKQSGK